ncbi:MAG: hypothetical protein H0W84_12340 [Bacteroidetes bacterium]|nr:hypothetical protein [Bacteroidota bacterium]
MKRSKIFLVSITLCFSFTTVFCQDNDDKQKKDDAQKIKKFKIVDVYLSNGSTLQGNHYGTLSGFQKLAPQSVLLKQDMSNYSSSKPNGMGDYLFSHGYAFSAGVGIIFSDKAKTKYIPNPELRVGITYNSGTSLSYDVFRSDSKRYDTLTSSQTGGTVFVDSVFYRQYSMKYNAEQLKLDVSLIYRTNPTARWSVYGGIGVNVGVSIKSYTDINFYENASIKSNNIATSNPNLGAYNSPTERNVNHLERFTNANSYAFAFYAPLGLDFRLGKKREFFKRLHLYYEAQPTINVTDIPEIGSDLTARLKNNLGLRVSF